MTDVSEKVNQIQIDVAEIKAEQRSAGRDTKRLCDKLDRYATETTHRIAALENDVGSRTPDAPSAFAQLQSLNGFASRVKWIGTTVVGFVLSLIGGILTFLAQQFWSK